MGNMHKYPEGIAGYTEIPLFGACYGLQTTAPCRINLYAGMEVSPRFSRAQITNFIGKKNSIKSSLT
jgi:hypothetical protein